MWNSKGTTRKAALGVDLYVSAIMGYETPTALLAPCDAVSVTGTEWRRQKDGTSSKKLLKF